MLEDLDLNNLKIRLQKTETELISLSFMCVLGDRHNAQEVVWKFQCGGAGISLSLIDDCPSTIHKSFGNLALRDYILF